MTTVITTETVEGWTEDESKVLPTWTKLEQDYEDGEPIAKYKLKLVIEVTDIDGTHLWTVKVVEGQRDAYAKKGYDTVKYEETHASWKAAFRDAANYMLESE